MSNEYYLNEHACEEGCPCELILSGWKDDKGDWKESVFAFKDANHKEFVPHFSLLMRLDITILKKIKNIWIVLCTKYSVLRITT